MRFETVLPIHPRTGLRAVGIVAGRPVWPILGGAEEGEGESEGGGGKFTPPQTQEEFDAIFEKRLARERNKLASQYGMTPEEAKVAREKAAKHDELEFELSSDKDKAVREASEKARKEALAEATPRLVRAEFKAAAKGLLTPEQMKDLMEFVDEVDKANYLDANGNVDEEKIAKRIAGLFPAPTKGNGGTQQHRPLGQGHQSAAAPSARDLGRAEAEKRFGKTQ